MLVSMILSIPLPIHASSIEDIHSQLKAFTAHHGNPCMIALEANLNARRLLLSSSLSTSAALGISNPGADLKWFHPAGLRVKPCKAAKEKKGKEELLGAFLRIRE